MRWLDFYQFKYWLYFFFFTFSKLDIKEMKKLGESGWSVRMINRNRWSTVAFSYQIQNMPKKYIHIYKSPNPSKKKKASNIKEYHNKLCDLTSLEIDRVFFLKSFFLKKCL